VTFFGVLRLRAPPSAQDDDYNNYHDSYNYSYNYNYNYNYNCNCNCNCNYNCNGSNSNSNSKASKASKATTVATTTAGPLPAAEDDKEKNLLRAGFGGNDDQEKQKRLGLGRVDLRW